MSDENTGGLGLGFWFVSAVGLVWSLMGAMNYLGQMSPEALASMPESHRMMVEGRPAWATSGFAVSVWGGSLGCLLLLLRKSLAVYLLAASLAGTVVTMIPVLGAMGELGLSGGEVVLMLGMPLVVSAALLWYSQRAASNGWIR